MNYFLKKKELYDINLTSAEELKKEEKGDADVAHHVGQTTNAASPRQTGRLTWLSHVAELTGQGFN